MTLKRKNQTIEYRNNTTIVKQNGGLLCIFMLLNYLVIIHKTNKLTAGDAGAQRKNHSSYTCGTGAAFTLILLNEPKMWIF